MIDSLPQSLNEHAELIISLVKIALLLFIVLTVNAYLTWFERKVVAHMQSRWGPHRVGPHGLLQPAADGLKFLLKEDPTPNGRGQVHVLPRAADGFGAGADFHRDHSVWAGSDRAIRAQDLSGDRRPQYRMLALFAITALSVYGVALAGWSSNSKYPLLGGLRSSAQMVSYELALTMSVVGVLLMAGSFSLRDIVNAASDSRGIAAYSPGIFSRRFWDSSASSSQRSRRQTAFRSTCRKRNRNWSRDSTPNIRASNSRCFSSRNTRA